MNLRDISPSDLGEILRLNEESVTFLSPLTRTQLEDLWKGSTYHKVMEWEGKIAAFLLALDQSAVYESPNYLWFKARYPSFLYIDRVVVDQTCRRKGLAKRLYDDLIVYTQQKPYPRITCEIDIQPPNNGSIHFHDRYRFVEVGTQWPYDGKKQVSLRERILQPRRSVERK